MGYHVQLNDIIEKKVTEALNHKKINQWGSLKLHGDDLLNVLKR